MKTVQVSLVLAVAGVVLACQGQPDARSEAEVSDDGRPSMGDDQSLPRGTPDSDEPDLVEPDPDEPDLVEPDLVETVPPVEEPPGPLGGQLGDEGEDGPTESCGYDVWPGPDAAKEYYTCTRTSDDFACDCNGASVDEVGFLDGGAIDCETALESACGSAPDRTYCQDPRGEGTCWPDPENPERYECRCSPDEPVDGISAEDCRKALFAACSMACESDAIGQCTPSTDPLSYECGCERFSGGGRKTEALDCTQALSNVCEQAADGCRTSSLYGCNTASSICTPDVLGGFDCLCDDTPTKVTSADLEGEGSCSLAISIACGAEQDCVPDWTY